MEHACFRSRYITKELIRIFTEDTDGEDEEFEGFSRESSPYLSCRLKNRSMVSEEGCEEDPELHSEGDTKPPARRRSSGLCVAFRFPVRKSGLADTGAGGRRRPKPPPQPSTGGEVAGKTEDAEAQSRRARNIRENKEMLAKLFADLSSMPELYPVKTTAKKRESPKKRLSERQGERRNPARSARPPEHFGVEDPTILRSGLEKQQKRFKGVDINKLMEVKEKAGREGPRVEKRRKRHTCRPVEDITEEELSNVALTVKDKINDKEHGTTCHQCRQKTLDTKTICRNPSCVGVKGQFCGPCLRNRYGEDVRTVLLDPTWECPLCRAICNCSLCRKRDGRCATGALVRMAKYFGHSNVREYLESLQKELS